MSGIKPLSLTCILASATLALSATPNVVMGQEGREEVDCESICRVFPDRAPPECTCQADILGGSGSGGGDADYADPRVREIHEGLQQTWLEMTAGIDDYTVVQTASMMTQDGPMQLGPPVVIHFEKEWIEGYPMYRFVSPAELSNREQEARGEPTAGDVGGAMGQAIGLLGGGAAEAMGSDFDFTLSPEMSRELAELGELLNNLDQAAEAETRADLADELFKEGLFWKHAKEEQAGPCDELMLGFFWSLHYLGETDASNPPPETSDDLNLPRDLPFDVCLLVTASGPEIAEAGGAWLSSDSEDEFGEYRIEKMYALVGEFYVSHFSRHLIGMITNLVAEPSGESFRVSRILSDFAPEARFVARDELLSMTGAGLPMYQGAWAQRIQGIVDDLYMIVNQVKKVLVNNGPPTREQIAELLAEFAGDAGSGGGFPGP